MANKRTISRAAQYIVKGGTVDIKQALQQANAALNKLKRENLLLKQQLKDLSTYSKKQRQKIKSQAGQLKAAETKVQTLKKAVKIERTKRIKAQKAAAGLRTPKASKPKSYIDHLSKADRRKLYQTTLYVPQFARRLQEHYGNAWKIEWTADIVRVLTKVDPNAVKELIVALDLEKVYYESDQYYADAGIAWEAEYVYKTIMSYEN